MNKVKACIISLLVFLFNSNLQSKDLKQFKQQKQEDVKKVPIIFHEKYDISFLGIENLHPFDSKKYGKIFKNLQKSLNLKKEQFYSPNELDPKDLEIVHTKEYLNSLNYSKTIAQIAEIPPLKFIPNFILQKFVLTPMKYATSGTILGAQLALQYGWAINLSGGYHHAKANSGEGFCFFADIPLAVYKLHEKNPNLKIMILDLDAHQGNGYESIFKDDKRIVTFDVYNGQIYPRDFEARKFIKYDYPVKSFIKDKEYLNLLKTELPKAIKEFKPNLIIYNAGTDIFEKDPLGSMSVSSDGIIERDSFVFNIALNNQVPILMVLSGGYSKQSAQIISDSIEKIFKNIEIRNKNIKKNNFYIDNISWGKIIVKDQSNNFFKFKDVKISPNSVVEWDWNKTGTKHNPGIQIADFIDMIDSADIFILSRGMKLVLQVRHEIVKYLQDKGKKVYVLQSEEAVKLYNKLTNENKKVAALIHSTC